jgi:hypothetical protein
MVKGSCVVGCGRSLLEKAETLVEKNLACDQYWLGSTKVSKMAIFNVIYVCDQDILCPFKELRGPSLNWI